VKALHYYYEALGEGRRTDVILVLYTHYTTTHENGVVCFRIMNNDE
jgi:hypothetical protein